MLSRVAESIYWMSRYVQRAENVARVIDVNLNLMLDLPDAGGNQWAPLVITTGDYADFQARYDEATQENVIQFLTFDLQNPNSIVSCLRKARENARQVRDAISSEMWQQLNRSYLMVRAASVSRDALDSPQNFYDDVKMYSHLFEGLTDGTMTHAEPWHFAHMGRMFERADKTARILDVKYFIILPELEYVGTPYDEIQWSALLKSASAYEMYRKRFQRIRPEPVVRFLVLDREFPRAIHHCLILAQWSLHSITGTPVGTFTNVAEQRLGRLRGQMDYTSVDEVIAEGLHEYLDRFQTQLNILGHAVNETFFILHTEPSVSLGAPIARVSEGMVQRASTVGAAAGQNDDAGEIGQAVGPELTGNGEH